jgi:hypothetical protein
VACPFFYPTEKNYSAGWPFPARLPLGAGFCGTCRAGGEEFVPEDAALRDFCNLGYAAGCSRLPAERVVDCVRFCVSKSDRDSENSGEDRIVLQYVVERDHLPVHHGVVEYDGKRQRWLSQLDDACLQRQAEVYLGTYLERRPRRT